MLPGEGRPSARVLLVSNDGMFTELLEGALGQDDDIVLTGTAVDASEAIRHATTVCPDVVVVDEHMDEPSTAIAERPRHALTGVRVIVLTTSASEELVRSALAAGCAGLVTKDQSLAALVRAVRSVHAGDIVLDLEAVNQLVRAAERKSRDWDSGRLSRRECDVLDLLARGSSTADIAGRLFISVNTARNHIQRILRKLGTLPHRSRRHRNPIGSAP